MLATLAGLRLRLLTGSSPHGQNKVESFEFPVGVTKDANGFLKPVGNLFFDILERFNIPADRIQACPECSKFFWKRRTDTKTCDKDCLAALHSKKSHLKLRNGINKRKVEYYWHGKGFTNLCEKCGRPSHKCFCL